MKIHKILFVIALILVVIKIHAQTDGKYFSIRTAIDNPDLVTELELSSINSALPDDIVKLKHLKVLRLINLRDNYDLKQAFIQLAKLDSLKELYLYGNNHHELPEEISLLKHLKKIQLNFPIQENLPKVLLFLSKIDSLEYLSIRGFGITVLPNEMLMLKNLKGLSLADNPDLDYNQAFTLLSTFDKFERLVMDYNAVNPFPTSILKLKNLRYLDMKYMIGSVNLKEVCISLSSLDHLEYLNIKSNNLEHFPKEMQQLDGLKTLDISGNRVDQKEILNLKKLLPTTQIICTEG